MAFKTSSPKYGAFGEQPMKNESWTSAKLEEEVLRPV
jgi:hypothetical protein